MKNGLIRNLYSKSTNLLALELAKRFILFELFRLEEIAEILKNTEDYLHLVNTACEYAHKGMQQGKPLDIIVHNDTAASSAIATICERVQDENKTIIKDIDSLIKVR